METVAWVVPIQAHAIMIQQSQFLILVFVKLIAVRVSVRTTKRIARDTVVVLQVATLVASVVVLGNLASRPLATLSD
jgi:hypothetical protein